MRRSATHKRLKLWGVAAILFAAAFLLAGVAVSSAAEEATVPPGPAIDTAAQIDQTQCVPCHLDLGSVSEPGLIFSHGNHLMVSCDGCHSRMPHRQGATEKVPMEVCFACHGVEHGPQGELATGECKDCHTESKTLRPKTHSKDWAKRPHADAGNKNGVNSCMMCHEGPADCDKCHADQAPDVPAMPNVYHPMIQPRPKDPSIKVYPDGPVSMSQCVYCHPDLDAITPGRLIFAHAAHLQRNYRCEACHPTFSHNETGIEKPDMLSCYRCHGLQHASQGQVATEECEKCHPSTFELMPADHTKKFIKGDHKKKANLDPAYCAMCHSSEFCVGCHRGEKTSVNAPGKPVIPADHRKADWMVKHGPIFMDGEGSCGSCHTDQSCKRCHKTVMPHPVGWIDDHAPEPGITTEDCNICHQDRSACQKCHHQSVRRAELVEKNCTPCHEEMKHKPATEIKNKGFAEHAVHFNVATQAAPGFEPKRKPYTCDDCHIGFGTSRASQQHNANGGLPDAGHDVRLCYGCHGAVDYQNQIIAPYPGAELCIQCHKDLNV